jgi:hypothetical protein
VAFEAELAVLHLRPFPVGGRSVDVRVAEEKSYFDCLLLRRLADFADVDRQLAQRTHVALVDKLYVGQLGLVENDAHDGLASADRTVYFSVNLVDAHRVSLPNKGVKDVLAELLALDDHLFAGRVHFLIEDCERVDSVRHLGNARSDGARVEPVEAGASHH